MIFEDSHYFVFIEVRDPMEESVEVSSGISIEGLADRIDRHMVVGKFDFVSIVFECLDHVILLVAA